MMLISRGNNRPSRCFVCSGADNALEVGQAHTQKSTSRLPALPNSRSPVWKVTVILSSRCRLSWKHSMPWAGSTMLCALTTWKATIATANSDLAAQGRCILTSYSRNFEIDSYISALVCLRGVAVMAKRSRQNIIIEAGELVGART